MRAIGGPTIVNVDARIRQSDLAMIAGDGTIRDDNVVVLGAADAGALG
jgi:hypothetical protein